MFDSFVFAVALAKATTHPAARTNQASTHAERTRNKLAPADQYFGRLRMSALAIRMRIDVLGRRYHARSASDDDLLHDAGDVETAMHLWHDRYPDDTWLPPTAFHLAQLYAAIQTPIAHSRATAAFEYVGDNFPRTRDGHLARLRIAQGLRPLQSESPIVASPSPVPAPALSGSLSTPSALPSATSTPNAGGSPPAPSPVPAASRTPH